jgi:hypothetical protein
MTVQFGFNDVRENGDSDLGDVWQNCAPVRILGCRAGMVLQRIDLV